MFINGVHEIYISCLRYRSHPWDVFFVREAQKNWAVIIAQAPGILHSCLHSDTVYREGMEKLHPNHTP